MPLTPRREDRPCAAPDCGLPIQKGQLYALEHGQPFHIAWARRVKFAVPRQAPTTTRKEIHA